MNDPSRRSVLAGAGAGVAVGVIGLGTAAHAAAVASEEPLLVQIDDPRSGELTIMVGDDEIVVVDADLVSRLVAAAGRR